MTSQTRIVVTVALCAALGLAANRAEAANQPDQLISGKKLMIVHKSDTSKGKMIFLSKDTGFALPDASNDPTLNGATLTVLDLGTGGSSVTLTLDKTRWTALNGGFKYTGQTGDPCKTIIIKQGKLIKGVCKGAAITLTPPLVGAAGVILRVGSTTIRYCAEFTNPTKNSGSGPDGTFKAKSANAPAACPLCGNGTLDQDEQCDDGNNVSGDCCSATCSKEPNGNPCSDGNPCTENDSCVAGMCVGSPTCGNGAVDAGCGEQCDLPDDSACPGLCMGDCTCAPAPTCSADPGRVLFLAAGEDLCQNLNTQVTCESAFVRPGAGETSCYWDGANCNDCSPDNQAQGFCRNTCDPVFCQGDPSRTIFAGGPETSACRQYDGDQASCEAAFHIGQYGIASCYYDSGNCLGCGPSNQQNGSCVNTCAVCGADPTRTIFAGGANTEACHQFDGDQASCEAAFHKTQCGSTASCYYDSGSDSCNGCGPQNEQDGNCQNTCEVGPFACTQDPSRTVFVGGPNSSACHVYDGDPASCETAFHRTQNGKAASCYYDYDSNSCSGCGPSNVGYGYCVNTCVSGPPTCADPSRTKFLGGSGSGACGIFSGTSGSAVDCESSFHLDRNGNPASCFFDATFNLCHGCGPSNESSGECHNTCRPNGPSCPNDPSRTIFAGGPNTHACEQFDGNQAACEAAFHLTAYGVVASCFYDSGNCRGCGPNNEQDALCTNTCAPPPCPGDATRTVFAGGPNESACHQFDGLPAACAMAYHLSQNDPASCYYDSNSAECRGCGATNQASGNCTNTCAKCLNDPSRTTYAGGPNTDACHQYDGDQATCEKAFHASQYGQWDSCFYDTSFNECRGCGPHNRGNGDCVDTCLDGPIKCARNPARTLFAGGPDTAACHQYDGNPASCAIAFHHGHYGYASCYYDASAGECLGCGQNNAGIYCVNECSDGPVTCELDPSRIFAGGPNTGACHQFDGNRAACETHFHLDQNLEAASCYYDSDTNLCNGCGPNNTGNCMNTCTHGPQNCSLDASRATDAGGPGTNACQQFTDEVSCLAAFHVGKCGVASCYWDGASCSGCGPANEFNASCFNTCVSP